jgi:hypothetical protein
MARRTASGGHRNSNENARRLAHVGRFIFAITGSRLF